MALDSGGKMKVEEQYQDVLQNIEFGIVMTYRDYPEMSDYDVLRTLEALIDNYVAEKIGRGVRKSPSSDVERVLYKNVHRMCEWRLGRSSIDNDPSKERCLSLEPKTVDEILICLKRIVKSVNMWNKRSGRQGYLQFVSQFIK